MGCKIDRIYRRIVVRVLIDFVPCAIGFLPDDDFSVVATRSKHVAIHRVSPGKLPYWTFMAVKLN